MKAALFNSKKINIKGIKFHVFKSSPSVFSALEDFPVIVICKKNKEDKKFIKKLRKHLPYAYIIYLTSKKTYIEGIDAIATKETLSNAIKIGYGRYKELLKIKYQNKLLEEKVSMLQDLLDTTPDIIYFKDIQGRLLLVNKAHASGHNKNAEEIIGKTDFQLFPYQEALKMTLDDLYIMQSKKAIIDRIEYTTRPSGQKLYVSTTKVPRFDKKGNVIGIMGITRDITKRIEAEKEIKYQKRLFEGILNSFNIPVYVIDHNHKVIFWNTAAEQLTGIPKERLLGTSSHWEAFYETKQPCLADLIIDGKWKSFKTENFFVESISKTMHLKNIAGRSRWIVFTATPLRDSNDEIIGAVETFQDITEQKKKEIQYAELSLKDSLTNLRNSRYLRERISSEIKRCRRINSVFSIIILDLDYFKTINDAYGHIAGDNLLRQFANFLKSVCRETDIPTRYGGEEFILILPDTDTNGAIDLAKRILLKLKNKLFFINEHKTNLSASLGIATYYPSCETTDMLIKRADAALRKAKEKGGKTYMIAKHTHPAGIQELKPSIIIHKLQNLQIRYEQPLYQYLIHTIRSIEGTLLPANYIYNITKLASQIGNKLNMNKTDINKLVFAASIADLGILYINKTLLVSKKISDEQKKQIMKHPQYSAKILQSVSIFKDIVDIIKNHHNKAAPSIFSRIIGTLQIYISLTSDRPYRKAFSREKAFKIMETDAKNKIDTKILNILKQIV